MPFHKWKDIEQCNRLILTPEIYLIFCFVSANGLKYHRSKTKGCDLPVSGYQLEKSDKSSNSEGDTEDSATEDFTSQEMSADESHNYHQHLHMNDNSRGMFIHYKQDHLSLPVFCHFWNHYYPLGKIYFAWFIFHYS